MVRKLGIIGAVVATLVFAFGATEASAKGGMGGGKWGKGGVGIGKWGKGGVGIGIGAGIGLGLGLAAIAVSASQASNCYRQRIVTPEGDILIRRVCD